MNAPRPPPSRIFATRRRVLNHVLALFPETLTELELLKEMTGGLAATFEERDRHRRAVRDLAAGDLLGTETRRVIPTRAALLFHELAEL
jgi:hypothetical protein